LNSGLNFFKGIEISDPVKKDDSSLRIDTEVSQKELADVVDSATH